MIFKIKKVKQ